MNQEQAQQMASGQGFIAALDQSGGSTPKALRLYGIGEDAWSDEAGMFDLIHQMRERIATAPGFSGNRVIGAILFEKTMDRAFAGKPAAEYLWENRGIVPFLKVDKGLTEPENGVKLMKEITGLDELLARALSKGMFGTKMRSVIDAADPQGIKAIVDQQFAVGLQIHKAGLMPILEPEVTISIADKAEAEEMLKSELLSHLDALDPGTQVMLKLTLPTEANLYKEVIAHPGVMRVVALSGGYSRAEANEKLAANAGMIASFSRGLTEGLSAGQADAEFNATLDGAIQSIYDASVAG